MNQMPQHDDMWIWRGALNAIDLSKTSIEPKRKEMKCLVEYTIRWSVETDDWWAIEELTSVRGAYIVKAYTMYLHWVIGEDP